MGRIGDRDEARDDRRRRNESLARAGGGFLALRKSSGPAGSGRGIRGASRDSHLRVEILDAEILERGRPGSGGGLGDRARGLGACARGGIQTSDVGWKDVALATRRRRGARARGRRSRRGSRERRARISPRHPRRTRVARRSNPRHGRRSDHPPATSGGSAEGGDNNEGRLVKKSGGRSANAPFFAAQTTWTRRAGATRAGAAARTAEPATRARAESTTGVEVMADIVVPNDGGLVVSACTSLQVRFAASFHVGRPPFRSFSYEHFGENRFESSRPRVNRPWVRVPSR